MNFDLDNFCSMVAVIVHGGACSIPSAIAEACVAGCVEAAEKANQLLLSGKSAVDAGNYCKLADNCKTS